MGLTGLFKIIIGFVDNIHSTLIYFFYETCTRVSARTLLNITPRIIMSNRGKPILVSYIQCILLDLFNKNR